MCTLKEQKQNSLCHSKDPLWTTLSFDPGQLNSVFTSEQNQSFVLVKYFIFPTT